MSKKNDKIIDFGEKIGGARKDLAALNRMLRGEDIESWNAEERNKYLKKQQIYKRPDYQKMIDGGMPREVAYFIKTVYDALPAKPPYKTENGQKAFVNFLNYYKERIDGIQTKDDAANFFNNAVKSSPYIERGNTGYKTSSESYGCMTSKLFKAAQYQPFRLQSEIAKRQFGYSENEKLTSRYTFIHFDGDNVKLEKDIYYNSYSLVHRTYNRRTFYIPTDEMSNPSNWEKDTWVAMNPNRTVFAANFESKEAAMEAVAEFEKNRIKNEPPKETESKPKRKQRLVPPQLEHVIRIGEDYLDGGNIEERQKLDENGKPLFMLDEEGKNVPVMECPAFENILGLRGGQFGEWENQNDRQTNLNMAFEAFKDLAKALNMSDKDVSLGGNLAMAWGARGGGKALAHFERAENVINLTKIRGAGNLAHEWGHALDYYIARMDNSYSLGMATEYANYNSSSPVYEVMQAIKYTVKNGVRQPTQYYNDAMALDGSYSTEGNQKSGREDKGYWHSNVELFARAFATYVMDKLEPNRNDYLCGHAQTSVPDLKAERMIYTYPRGEEREAINKAFDKLIDTLKVRMMLNERTEQDNHKLIQEEYKDNSIIVEEVKPAAAKEEKSFKSAFDDKSEFVQMSLFDMLEQEQYQPKSAAREVQNPFERY